VAQVVGAMEALEKMAGPRRFLLVGDSKLISYTNLKAFDEAGVSFIAPAPKAYVPAAVLAERDLADTVAVDYIAERDADKPADQRGAWRVSEDTMIVSGPRKADPDITLRRAYVYSSARAQAAAHARDKKLDRTRDDLGRLERGLGSRHYPDAAAVEARITQIARERKTKAYLVATVASAENAKPTLEWSFDQAAIDAEAATDGWYALLTNLDDQVDAGEILRRYKGQEAVERRYGNFKGPLAVAPVFVKSNRRLEALISVICLALLIFCLIEREVRQAIAPATTMVGIYPEGRAVKPTGRLIFAALASMRLIPASRGGPPVIPRPGSSQLKLLELLDVDPTGLIHSP
jgi:transposase